MQPLLFVTAGLVLCGTLTQGGKGVDSGRISRPTDVSPRLASIRQPAHLLVYPANTARLNTRHHGDDGE